MTAKNADYRLVAAKQNGADRVQEARKEKNE